MTPGISRLVKGLIVVLAIAVVVAAVGAHRIGQIRVDFRGLVRVLAIDRSVDLHGRTAAALVLTTGRDQRAQRPSAQTQTSTAKPATCHLETPAPRP